ncbi:hypothetical protein RCL63_23000, partial [Salmonella enterica subsp. enterica serovar Stanley]
RQGVDFGMKPYLCSFFRVQKPVGPPSCSQIISITDRDRKSPGQRAIFPGHIIQKKKRRSCGAFFFQTTDKRKAQSFD